MTDTTTLKDRYDALQIDLSCIRGSAERAHSMADFISDVAEALGWAKPVRRITTGQRELTEADLKALPEYSSVSYVPGRQGFRARVLKCPDGLFRMTTGVAMTADLLAVQQGTMLATLPRDIEYVEVPA